MPKKLIKRYLPDHQTLRTHRHLQVFGARLHDPNLWHLNRRSASGAFAVGLFVAFVPIPLQMLLAAALAILARVNLPVSVALVWITNPITLPPVFYICYRVGAWILNEPGPAPNFEFSMEWLQSELAFIWQPFLLGSLLTGIASAVLGYCTVRGLWRLNLTRYHRRRKLMRAARESSGGEGGLDMRNRGG
ncbi:MAG: DUF2062 domain-containing protein [Gammaproteobacteria bacterium]